MSRTSHARLLPVLAITTMVAIGCGSATAPSPVKGAGAAKTESRTIAAFTRLEIRHGLELRLVVGEPLSLQVTAQQNLLDLVEVSQTGEKLVVDTTRDYASASGIVVRLAAPSITELVLEGGAHGTADGLDTDSLAIRADAASLTASGSADTLNVTARGGGVIDLADVTASTVTVDLAGGIKARVCATGAISGSAVGGVALTVRGKPATFNVAASGGAAVNEE